jgi:hypothetical protein
MEAELPVTNMDRERENASWRKAVAIVEAATGIRLRPTAWARLSRDERKQLVELSGKIAHRRGVDVSRLGRKERPVWEALIEKAARLPGFFAAARDEKEARHFASEMAKLAVEVRKPRRRVDLHEPGSLTLPRLWSFGWFAEADPVLWISHVGLLVFLWAQFENGECIIPGGHFETDDTGQLTLYINRKVGLGKQFDGDEQRLGWMDRVEHLADNTFFVTERSGGFLTVKLGSRLRAVRREAA